jgi:two-component system KDP operon response regulator KdpE
VGDDKATTLAIQRKLRRNNFSLEIVSTISGARRIFEGFCPDLVLLDLDLADSTGTGLLTDMRARGSVPIVTFSAARAERDAVAAFELGADDYLVKPLGLDELLARIRVALRHVARPEFGTAPVLRAGNLEIDIEQRRVLRNHQPVHLTPKEYQLLKLFATHTDTFLPDRLIIDELWGTSWRGGEHILHVYVARLRGKIEDCPATPRHLLTESGLGYRFVTATSSGPR